MINKDREIQGTMRNPSKEKQQEYNTSLLTKRNWNNEPAQTTKHQS